MLTIGRSVRLGCPELHRVGFNRGDGPGIFVISPVHPVAARNRCNGDEGHGQEHAGDSVQFGAGEHRDDDRQRMQPDAWAHQARVHDEVFQYPENREKRDRPDRQAAW